MPDITMCKNEACTKKDTCYRYMAIPDPIWQAYFFGVDEDSCGSYWKLEPGRRVRHG